MDVNINANGQAKRYVTVLSICKKCIFIWATFKFHQSENSEILGIELNSRYCKWKSVFCFIF